MCFLQFICAFFLFYGLTYKSFADRSYRSNYSSGSSYDRSQRLDLSSLGSRSSVETYNYQPRSYSPSLYSTPAREVRRSILSLRTANSEVDVDEAIERLENVVSRLERLQGGGTGSYNREDRDYRTSKKSVIGRRYWIIGYMYENLKESGFSGNGFSTELSFSNALGISRNLSISFKYFYTKGDMGEELSHAWSNYYRRIFGEDFSPAFNQAISDGWSNLGRANFSLELSYQFASLFNKNFRPNIRASIGSYGDQAEMAREVIDYYNYLGNSSDLLNLSAPNIDWNFGTSYSIGLGAEYLLGEYFTLIPEINYQNFDPTIALSLGAGWLFTDSNALIGTINIGDNYFGYNADFYWNF
jgi:hypothetical protein